jgi:hypothetical protein
MYRKSNQAILSEFQVRRTKVKRSGRFHWESRETPDFASSTGDESGHKRTNSAVNDEQHIHYRTDNTSLVSTKLAGYYTIQDGNLCLGTLDGDTFSRVLPPNAFTKTKVISTQNTITKSMAVSNLSRAIATLFGSGSPSPL